MYPKGALISQINAIAVGALEIEKKVLTEGPLIGKQAFTKAVLLTRKNRFAKDLRTRRTVHSTGALLRLKSSIPVGALWTGKSAHTKGALRIGMSVLTSGTSPVTTRGLLVMIALKFGTGKGSNDDM